MALNFYYMVLAILHCIGTSFGYRPVIIIHGILDSASDLGDLQKFITDAHPGTPVHAIDLFDYYNSFQPLWHQVEAIRNVTIPIIKAAKDGVNIIGYSQGGLVARGLIQTTDNHNVHSFIALSSPLNGQYGDTYVFKWLFPHYLKEELYKLFYTAYGQKWSIGNYWKDPHKFEEYQRYSEFLADINNETIPEKCRFKDSWKNNFSSLKNLVLVGGPDDGVITPWQSAQFGFFNENEEVVPMRGLKIYENDVFGLRTLDKRKSILPCTFSNITHLDWHKNIAVFNKCIKPFIM